MHKPGSNWVEPCRLRPWCEHLPGRFWRALGSRRPCRGRGRLSVHVRSHTNRVVHAGHALDDGRSRLWQHVCSTVAFGGHCRVRMYPGAGAGWRRATEDLSGAPAAWKGRSLLGCGSARHHESVGARRALLRRASSPRRLSMRRSSPGWVRVMHRDQRYDGVSAGNSVRAAARGRGFCGGAMLGLQRVQRRHGVRERGADDVHGSCVQQPGNAPDRRRHMHHRGRWRDGFLRRRRSDVRRSGLIDVHAGNLDTGRATRKSSDHLLPLTSPVKSEGSDAERGGTRPGPSPPSSLNVAGSCVSFTLPHGRRRCDGRRGGGMRRELAFLLDCS
jgi:hypothetical protein